MIGSGIENETPEQRKARQDSYFKKEPPITTEENERRKLAMLNLLTGENEKNKSEFLDILGGEINKKSFSGC